MSSLSSFDDFWSSLQRVRPIGRTNAWSIAGKTRSTFEITDIEAGSVTVQPDSGARRRISKSDFAKVFERWTDYKTEHLPRQDLREISQNSTYILTILHIIESQ